MAGSAINLIPGEEKASIEVIDLLRKIKFFAFISLVCFLVCLFTSIILLLSLNSKLVDISQKILITEGEIRAKHSVETDLAIFKNRLELAKKIIKERRKTIEALSMLWKIKSEEIVFESIESPQKGTLIIGVISPNLFSFNKFLTAVSDPEFTKNFSKIEIASTSRSVKGIYSVILECVEKDEKN